MADTNNGSTPWGQRPENEPWPSVNDDTVINDPADSKNAKTNESASVNGASAGTDAGVSADSNERPTEAINPVAARDEQPTQVQAPAQPQQPAAQPAQSQQQSLPLYGAYAPQGAQQYGAQHSQYNAPQAAPQTPAPYQQNAAPQNNQQPQQPEYGQYRPAPEFGAYGPVPPQNQPDANAQQPNTANGGNGNGGNGVPPRGGSPFNPFRAPQNPQGPGNNAGAPGQGQDGQGGAKPNGVVSHVVTGAVAAVVAAALSLGVGFAAISNGWVSSPTSSSLSSVSNSSGSGTAKAESGEAVDWTAVAKKVAGSVVAIQTTIQSGGQTGVAKGSGAIISKDGDIVTNNHVVSGATQIQVTLSDGSLYEADVVGTDVTTDLAVIKLKNAPSDLTVAEFADSDNLAVGENVMAIGNPLGYENTATTGIVSALNRPVTVMDDENNEIVTNAVQIDAAINPGNSGGPTFNAAGQIIGINSSIATSSSSSSSSSSSGSIGIGFAIPSNLVTRVTSEITSSGSVKHVALGVTVKTDTATADGTTRAGSAVQSVVSGGPADKAGVKQGDVIVGYNGKTVGSNASLLGFVRATALNDTVKLTVVRDGKTIELSATMDQEESAVNGSNRSESSNGSSGNSQNNNNGGSGSNGDSGSGDSNTDPFNFGW
ncbi:S1C family serine protease [Bifidobacterium callimiconis]|uniref:Peptidase n=1 Tax=Bifidobacterium callimiconis TaxID=2306973 RepID=A0A430F9C7_9BIFI|nr:trypsin-like peptidase domain-containing protein [Bifidobacterium callimiconis]RSX49433.1 peptidase [Bifidobacterium callimiconis]